MKSFIEKEAQEKAEEILAKVHYIHCVVFCTNVNGTEYIIECILTSHSWLESELSHNVLYS